MKPSEGTLVGDSGSQSHVMNLKACWMSGLSKNDQKDLSHSAAGNECPSSPAYFRISNHSRSICSRICGRGLLGQVPFISCFNTPLMPPEAGVTAAQHAPPEAPPEASVIMHPLAADACEHRNKTWFILSRIKKRRKPKVKIVKLQLL